MREQLEGIVVKWFNKIVNIVTVAAHHADSHYLCGDFNVVFNWRED